MPSPIIQAATSHIADGAAASITVTFTNNITALNSVVVCFSGFDYAASLGDVTVTPASGGDTYTVVDFSSGNDPLSGIAYVLSSSGGYKSVTVHNNLGFDEGVAVWAYEVHVLTALDRVSTNSGSPTAWSSGTTATTTQASEVAFGVGAIQDSFSCSISGPSSLWTNETAYNDFA